MNYALFYVYIRVLAYTHGNSIPGQIVLFSLVHCYIQNENKKEESIRALCEMYLSFGWWCLFWLWCWCPPFFIINSYVTHTLFFFGLAEFVYSIQLFSCCCCFLFVIPCMPWDEQPKNCSQIYTSNFPSIYLLQLSVHIFAITIFHCAMSIFVVVKTHHSFTILPEQIIRHITCFHDLATTKTIYPNAKDLFHENEKCL